MKAANTTLPAAAGRVAALRRIGSSDAWSQAMALGCYSMSNSYGERTDQESRQVIGRAIDEGVNLIDTADFYGWGHNETLVGSALRGRRGKVLLSSKFGYVPSASASFALCSRPAYVRQACEASLKRLNTDHLDLYFQHRLDPEVPIEDTVGAMAELVQEGKVRYLGLCEVSERTLRRAHAVHPISAVQAEYSLWTRDVEQNLMPVLKELGVTLLAFSPLGRGMLTGQLRGLDQLSLTDVRRKFPRFSPENFSKNVALVDRLKPVAEELGCTTSQLVLAWIYEHSPNVIAICGCDTLPFLNENLSAMRLQLSKAQIETMSNLFAPGQVSGDRYGAALMQFLDRS